MDQGAEDIFEQFINDYQDRFVAMLEKYESNNKDYYSYIY